MSARRLHRYLLEEEVGHGGMAAVYRGRDTSLDREVAVKVLYPHLAARPEHRLRLAREARAVARLKHPAIVEIYDFSGEDGEDAYIVTELIRGRTLRAFATEHPFDPPELAAACVYELAGALEHAHSQGIVHRDIKPENVMVREEGGAAVKLMDFGIAQILDRDDRMTMTGALMGSPAHMAPEIIGGEDADERSDIFSMGTILYWLATHELPYEAPNPGALLKRILEGDYRDPRQLRPAISDELAQIIIDCLAPRPERIQNASELRKRLKLLLDEAEIERPNELLAQFITSPESCSRELRQQIITSLLNRGHKAVEAKRPAKALALFARVISIAPGTVDAGAARDAIEGLKTRNRRRRLAFQLAAGGALLTVLIAGGSWAYPQMSEAMKQPGGIQAAFGRLLGLEEPVSGGDGEETPSALSGNQKEAIEPALDGERAPQAKVDLDSAEGSSASPDSTKGREDARAGRAEGASGGVGPKPALPPGNPGDGRSASEGSPGAEESFAAGSNREQGQVDASLGAGTRASPTEEWQGAELSKGTSKGRESDGRDVRVAMAPDSAGKREGASGTSAGGAEERKTEGLAMGRVFITVKPFAHISLNGKSVGTTPWEGDAPVGRQTFVLTHDCCEALEIEGEVRGDRRLELREKLVPIPARIQLELEGPPDTGIMLDDAFWAYASEATAAPLPVPMARDAHGEPRYDREVSLRLFRAGYHDQIVPVRVRAGQLKLVKVRLEPQG